MNFSPESGGEPLKFAGGTVHLRVAFAERSLCLVEGGGRQVWETPEGVRLGGIWSRRVTKRTGRSRVPQEAFMGLGGMGVSGEQ